MWPGPSGHQFSTSQRPSSTFVVYVLNSELPRSNRFTDKYLCTIDSQSYPLLSLAVMQPPLQYNWSERSFSNESLACPPRLTPIRSRSLDLLCTFPDQYAPQPPHYSNLVMKASHFGTSSSENPSSGLWTRGGGFRNLPTSTQCSAAQHSHMVPLVPVSNRVSARPSLMSAA